MAPMNKQPFQSVAFEWLSETGEPVAGSEDRSFGESGWVEYAMPPEVGKGGYEAFELTLGMTLVRSTLEFSPLVLGKLVPLMEVDVEFKEPSLQVMALRGLHGSIKEAYPPAQMTASPGVDIFRYTTHYLSSFAADGTFSGTVISFSVGRTVLNQLIGDEVAESLLVGLGIANIPSITVCAIPLHISQLMFNAVSSALSGTTQKLFCQAKILEYLAALMHHVCASAEVAPDHSQKSRRRAQVIHAQLMATEGKLPTLDELAEQYGRSAKLLNEEFAQEFGKSVYGFITDHRLTQAHAALEHSDVTIKQLAAKLGYTHVNNFTSAFKRTFGYPPGTLRRR